MAVDKTTFFGIMGAFPSGVTIVTTVDDEGQPRGLTSNAFSSVSAEPPLLLVCVDKRSNTLPALLSRKRFVVNFLSEGRGPLSDRFASKEPDKFAGVSWQPAENGMPWLTEDSVAYAACSTVQEIDSGDHIILVGQVDSGQPPTPDARPLLYFRRTYAGWPDA